MLSTKYPRILWFLWKAGSFLSYRDSNEALLKNIMMKATKDINGYLRSGKIFRGVRAIYRFINDFDVDRSNFQNIVNAQKEKLVNLYYEAKKFTTAKQIIDDINIRLPNISPIFHSSSKYFYLLFNLIFFLFFIRIYNYVFSVSTGLDSIIVYTLSFKMLISFMVLSIIPTLFSIKIVEEIHHLYMYFREDRLIPDLELRVRWLNAFLISTKRPFWFRTSPVFLIHIVLFIALSIKIMLLLSNHLNIILALLFSSMVFILIYMNYLVWYNLFAFVWDPTTLNPKDFKLELYDANNRGGLIGYGIYIEKTAWYCIFSIGLFTTLLIQDNLSSVISLVCIKFLVARIWLLQRMVKYYLMLKAKLTDTKKEKLKSIEIAMASNHTDFSKSMILQTELFRVQQLEKSPLPQRKVYNYVLALLSALIIPIIVSIISHYIIKYFSF